MILIIKFVHYLNYVIFAAEQGPVAEWLGRALQKLPQRFESALDLQSIRITRVILLFL